MKRWGIVLGLLVVATGIWATLQIHSERFYELSPLMPTSEKAILRMTSADGLVFETDSSMPVLTGAASQTHMVNSDGLLQIVATDPTVLNQRFQPDSPPPPRCSTLFRAQAPRFEREQLMFAPCVNKYGDRFSPPVQCVDPHIFRLEDGGLRLIYVRMAGTEDPAFAARPNQFFSAIGDVDGGWTFEPGVRFTVMGGADPDVVALHEGGYRMYFTKGDARGPEGKLIAPGVFSAVSTDGLTFEEEEGTRAFFCSASATVKLDTGGYRMYCHTRDLFKLGHQADPSAYIVSLYSKDGLTFSQDEGTRVGPEPVPGARYIGAGAPSVLQDPDGGVQMLLTTVVEPLFPWNYRVFTEKARHFSRVIKSTKERAPKGGPKDPPPGTNPRWPG